MVLIVSDARREMDRASNGGTQFERERRTASGFSGFCIFEAASRDSVSRESFRDTFRARQLPSVKETRERASCSRNSFPMRRIAARNRARGKGLSEHSEDRYPVNR